MSFFKKTVLSLFVISSMVIGAAVVHDTAFAAPKTNAYLNTALRYGMNTAVAMDWNSSAYPAYGDSCREKILLYGATRRGQDLYSNSLSPPGTSSSYRYETWLSILGQGNAATPVVVPYGSTTIDLQINSLMFTCRPFANPTPASSCNLTGTQWTTTSGWISSVAATDNSLRYSGSADYSNPASSSCFLHLKRWQHVQVLSLGGSDSTGTPGSAARISASDRLNISDDSTSRYWLATPMHVRYTSSSPITSSRTISVTATYKQQNYYADGVVTCTSPSGGIYSQYTGGSEVAWSNCDTRTTTYVISIVVPPPPNWTTSGTSSVSPSGVVPPSTPSATFTHTIRNDGPDTTDQAISAEIFQRINGGAPTSVGTFSRAAGLASGSTFSQNSVVTINAGLVGSVICQFVQWTPVSWNSAGPDTSAEDCVVIGALPRMSIVGGDAISGGSVGCSATTGGFEGSAGSLPGSFGEYALIIAPGSISNFGSTARPNYNGLKIANNPIVASYTASRCITDLASRITNGLSLTDIAGGSGPLPAPGDYRITGDFTFTATSGLTGQRILYAPGRTVTISGNIEYAAGPFPSFADSPSVTIIADRIRVDPSVSRIDATLIGTTSVTTCSATGDNPLSNIAAMAASPAGVCRTAPQLVVNGAVYTGHFMPTRSSGGGAPTEIPAEIIRYRPDVFLGPYERSRSNSILKTDSELELPARN